MVNIFGMKLFESPSIEEQMHHKGRHGTNCECPNCSKKRYRGRHGTNCESPKCGKKRHSNSSRTRFISRRNKSRSLRGGYTYKQNNKSMKEEDVTMELSTSKSISKSRSNGKAKASARGTRRRNH